jgi:hypothetical protein
MTRKTFAAAIGKIPQFARGMVWCHTCGREQRVDAISATTRTSWPVCCGHTMSIDSPEERRAMRGAAK